MKREFSKLPDPGHIEMFPELVKLVGEHAKTLGEFRAAKTRYQELETERARARRKDENAAVEAYRAGKRDPGSKHEDAVVKEMEALDKRSRLLESVYGRVETDIGNLLSQRRGEWLARIRDLVRGDDEEVSAALDRLREALDRRQTHAGLFGWVSEPGAYNRKVFVEGGFSEDVALNLLRSSVGRTLKAEEEDVA